MKKTWIPVLLALGLSSVAVAQDDVDNRPASKKAQDVYVEPTLRMTTVTTTSSVDPKTSQSQVVSEQKQVEVFNHKGQVVSDKVTDAAQVGVAPTQPAASQVAPVQQTVPAQQPAPVSSSKITDMSRPAQ